MPEESQGLRYLTKFRGPTMKHYLKFLGGSAKHLDKKTQYLMYVMLETIVFSPRGLEHYIKKASAHGASVDEILDAILVAYPGAGLAKVVDAVDILIDLGLGEPSVLKDG